MWVDEITDSFSTFLQISQVFKLMMKNFTKELRIFSVNEQIKCKVLRYLNLNCTTGMQGSKYEMLN